MSRYLLPWKREAVGVYTSGRFRIERDGKLWFVFYDGKSILFAYGKLWLAQSYTEGWALNHPELPRHGLRIATSDPTPST